MHLHQNFNQTVNNTIRTNLTVKNVKNKNFIQAPKMYLKKQLMGNK